AGQHAAAVAARLGMSTVLVHPFAAVLSAWGQTLARPERTAVRAIWRQLDEVVDQLPAVAEALRAGLGNGEADASVELRPVGTEHPLAVPLAPTRDELVAAFVAAHRRAFGFDRE